MLLAVDISTHQYPSPTLVKSREIEAEHSRAQEKQIAIVKGVKGSKTANLAFPPKANWK